MKVLISGGFVAATTTALLIACSSSDSAVPSNADGGPPQDGGYLTDAGGFVSTCTPPTAPTTVQAACTITLDTRPVQSPPQLHLPVGTAIDYCTNPPSGGAHYPIWANFGEITHPIPWPYLVHNEEHGAILLLYNCPQGCDDIVDQLRQVVTRAPADPICAAGVKRFVIAPATDIPSKVAAAAWGNTLTSDCVDAPTFDAFVAAHYGNGPEIICAEGQAFP